MILRVFTGLKRHKPLSLKMKVCICTFKMSEVVPRLYGMR